MKDSVHRSDASRQRLAVPTQLGTSRPRQSAQQSPVRTQPAGCLGASREVLGPCNARWPLAALPEAANFRRSRFGLRRPQAMARAVFRQLELIEPTRPFRPVTPCWPGGCTTNSGARLGSFIATRHSAMCQTQNAGPAAAWPGRSRSRRRSWGSMPFAALILSVGPARFRASQPTCRSASITGSAVFTEGRAPRADACGAHRPGNPPRLLGFPTGSRPLGLAALGFSSSRSSDASACFIAAGRADRVSSPGPAIGLRTSASGS